MNGPMVLALLLAAGLLALGVLTGSLQVRGLRRLRDRKHVPSDERAYLLGRYRRRLVNAVLLGLAGGLMAGAYLSGMIAELDALGQPRPANPDGSKPPMTPEQEALFERARLYVAALILVVASFLGVAVADAFANRRYLHGQLRQLREEHQAKLRRDLAVHRAQREKHRGGITGQRVDGTDG